MTSITINPAKIAQFNGADKSNFYLVTNSDLAKEFYLENTGGAYSNCEILIYDGGDFKQLLHETREPAHVLVISPNHLIASVKESEIGHRKIAVMAVNSTPTTLSAIEHFLTMLTITDPNDQQAFAETFFEKGQKSKSLRFVDLEFGAEAIFHHLDESYQWFEQSGPLDWGGQQLAPAGEVSVLPLFHGKYDPGANLDFNGQIAFRGLPILHSGKVNFLREDQSRLHDSLSSMRNHAVIATFKDGVATGLEATHDDALPAKQALDALFFCDSRYRRIWEIGFGINRSLTTLPGNIGMNEVFGGSNGVVHFGLGLTPFTQYHLDILCPHTQVFTDSNELLIGSAK